jgi:peptide/nickel transport system ATP-binding protein
MNKILGIKNLEVKFYTYEGVVHALERVSFDIYKKETFGLVGETGCGKTMTALSILQLVPPPGRIEGGNIYLYANGDNPIDLLTLKESEMRKIRGSTVSMVFQEPSAALNPVFTIKEQISEVVLVHRKQEMAKNALSAVNKRLSQANSALRVLARPAWLVQRQLYSEIANNPRALLPRFVGRIPFVKNLLWRLKDEANNVAIDMLKQVEIPDPKRVANQYPYQISGGMKQRAVIAMSLTCCQQFLIADEPTTALDVTIQSQILELLRRLKEDLGTSVLYITHDLAVAAQICNRIGVMYSGRMCEIAPVKSLFARPVHPYTKALMEAVPIPGKKPQPIDGTVPDPLSLPDGCCFWPRCPIASDICKKQIPEMTKVATEHYVSCHNWQGGNLGSSG